MTLATDDVVPSRRAEALPYLSHSRVAKYLHCPEQYRLYYVKGLRRRIPDASLVFGQVVHQALAGLFQNGEDPVDAFTKLWTEVESADLVYGVRESWAKLKDIGRTCLQRFVDEELPKLQDVTASEKPFRLMVTSLCLPFVGVIDLTARLNQKRTVIDFKTAASGYQEHEATLSDQLTAYQLAEPEAEQSALCVFVKTKEPRIDWLVSERQPDQVLEYVEKVEIIAQAISAGFFYKRPGRWCSYCDFLPLCLGDQAKVEETLVQVAPRP
ncbi:PD-(D/E)XK nuclease family protein [bacterium]|nr:PD-(D/E)XK nuclease family protein [bacterium]